MEKYNQKDINNINNKEKEKEKSIFEQLTSTEEDIFKLGDNITELLNILKNALKGNVNYKDECKEKLKEILILVDKIKSNMHELVDKVYSKRNYTFHSKLSKDFKDKENELKIIFSKFKSYFPIANERQQNPPYEKKPFSVDRK